MAKYTVWRRNDGYIDAGCEERIPLVWRMRNPDFTFERIATCETWEEARDRVRAECAE
ncbi:MAG TPA: hypothetical protein VGG75_06245 [Trebonia sp.]|jgi:hypothetical protein